MKKLRVIEPKDDNVFDNILSTHLIDPLSGSRKIYGANQTVPMISMLATGAFASRGFVLSNEYIWHFGIDPMSGITIIVPEVRL